MAVPAPTSRPGRRSSIWTPERPSAARSPIRRKAPVPPVVTLPANLVVNATSPAGAAVTYSASASDLLDPSPRVTCLPASGSVIPIATTTVTCTAADAVGTRRAPASASRYAVLPGRSRFCGRGHLPTSTAPGSGPCSRRPWTRLPWRSPGNRRVACRALDLYAAEVRAAPSRIHAVGEATLRADATRIRPVLGC